MNKFHSRLAVSSTFFLHGLCFSSWGARIPAIQEKLGLSEAQLGTVLFALPIGSILSMPASAYLVNRFGSRLVLIFGLLFYATALTTLGMASSVYQLTALLIVFGFVSNFVNVSGNTQGIDLEILYKKTIMSSLHGLWSAAGFFGAALSAVLISFDVIPLWHFTSVFVVVLITVLLNNKHLLRDKKKAVASSRPKFVFPNKQLVGLGIIAFCCMLCEGAMFDWGSVYFKKVLGAEGGWVSAGYVAFMTTMASSRFFADNFREKYGLKRILLFGGVIICSGFMTSVLFPTILMSVIGFLLIGIGVSGIVPLVISEAGKTTTMSASAAIASVSTIGFLGFLIGPPMVGWIAGATSLRVSFSVIAVMGLSISFIALRFKDHAAQAQVPEQLAH
jgi:MFS family permease